MFKGRNLVIATKHNKEKVIAPILEKELGVKCIVDANIDTDLLGTFSGEIERKYDPITTAKNKCILAMQITNCDLAVASEGSFGPHPTLYFAPADDEFLILIDKKNDLEIIARELSLNTNFNGAIIKTKNELKEFANTINFPSHGIIAKNSKDNFSEIEKGINSVKKLNETFNYFIKKYGSIYLETDMRAMNNPTRMKVIETATHKLVQKINSVCPICSAPGFDITDAKTGLPCENCNFPTQSALSYIYSCKKCSYTTEKKYPNNKFTESATYCDVCNP